MRMQGQSILKWGYISFDLNRHRIIRDFYIPQGNPVKRPKIFGMTASPVDARVDVVKAAK